MSFRDDTPKVLKKWQGVSTAGSPVWDVSSISHRFGETSPSLCQDVLPPFTCLTTDIEREMKADCYLPGTYHVVLNPDSFKSLLEYPKNDDQDTSGGSSDEDSTSANNSLSANRSQTNRSMENRDPNVIILTRFEDSLAPGLAYQDRTPTTPSTMSTVGSISATEIEDDISNSGHIRHNVLVPMDISSIRTSAEDAKLLHHFRTVVRNHLAQTDLQSDSPVVRDICLMEADIFEQVATTFRPLYHAMMAVSVLSLARRGHGKSVDSLQHYQQTLPFLRTSLRSHQDLLSDGLLLTHFLLLIYEIAAAEPRGSNLWTHHLRQLLRIFYMRQEAFEREPFPFVMWWICNIDMNALFSGAGAGEFVGAMLKNDMIPPPNYHLYPLGPDGTSAMYSAEMDTLPALLKLNRDIVVLGVKLGMLAVKWRREDSARKYTADQASFHLINTDNRVKQTLTIQESLRKVWTSSAVTTLEQQPANPLPRRSKELMCHCSVLFHSTLIYSYTSMWATQGVETRGSSALEIEQHASAIVRTATEIIGTGRLELRFIVFPVFMAGISTSSPSLKALAQDLLSNIENSNEGVGRNITTTRRLLQIVYQRQIESYMARGHSLDVDWIQIMVEEGLQVVSFGL